MPYVSWWNYHFHPFPMVFLYSARNESPWKIIKPLWIPYQSPYNPMQISFNHHKDPIKSFNHHSNELIKIIKVIQSPFFPWFSHGFPMVFPWFPPWFFPNIHHPGPSSCAKRSAVTWATSRWGAALSPGGWWFVGHVGFEASKDRGYIGKIWF